MRPRIPNDATRLDTVMTNFDHSINEAVAAKLHTGNYFAEYTGWNFFGRVWWDAENNTYGCEIWRYGSHIDTIAGTLEEIMRVASERYGDE